MTATTLTRGEVIRDTSRARKGPVFITNRGQPTHVLLTIEDYRRLTHRKMSLFEAVAQQGVPDFDFEPPRMGALKPNNLG